MRSHTYLLPNEEVEEITFCPFRLTHSPLRLCGGRREVELPPRPLGVLRYLVEHAGALVSRQELLQALWQGTVVTPAALHVCVREVRKALGDETNTPRYIETVGREGYRFIAPLSCASQVKSQKLKV